MLRLALATVRTRWVAFAGAFVALALGTAMIAMMALTLAATLGKPHSGPQRFAHAQTVVVPADPRGDAAHLPAALPDSVVSRLTALGPATADRTFGTTLRDAGPAEVGHGWSAVALGRHRLAAGRAPAAADEIVVGGGTPALLGRAVEATTPAGVGTYRVVGVTGRVWFEDAVFFTDAEAARLSPSVNALAVAAPGPRVREAAGDDTLVLAGARRVHADPDPSGGSNALTQARAMAGTTMVIAASVAVFIVIATFAFVVDQRRRELALLRLVGGTPGQVRRMVLAEAGLIGLAASAVGCVLGTIASGLLETWMIDHAVAPRWFDIGVNPIALLVAFTMGVASALVGAATVALRAARVHPAEALRDAAADTRSMTPLRWLLGLGMLAGAIITGVVARQTPELAVNPRKYGAVPLLFTGAFALLSPVVLRPVARLVTWPLSRLGAGPLLVRQNMLNSRRRTAATVTPVVIAVGLVATMLCVQTAGDRTRLDQAREQTHADWVVTPTGAAPLDARTLAALAAIPDVTVTTVAPLRIYVGTRGPAGKVVDSLTGQAVPAASLGTVLTPKVVEGALAGLAEDALVVDERTARGDDLTLGQQVYTWLPDGSRHELRIAAIIGTGLRGDATFLSATHPPTGFGPDRAWITLRPGADRTATAARLAAAIDPRSAQVGPVAAYFARMDAKFREQSRTAATVVLGISVGYALLSVANTLIMAAAGRRRELAALELAGATRAQILRVVAAESLIAAVVGVLLSAGAGAAVVATQWLSLSRIVDHVPLTAPWPEIGRTALLCTLVATAAAAGAAWRTTRGRAIDTMGMRE
ncbi:FtsX-like permease family protein [Embleya sp. AB8]|uniref:FtsX-like permease family protein n=1 Tax=Embleya sp. AB8 TaxID=3156304 RepID=UPI003C771506